MKFNYLKKNFILILVCISSLLLIAGVWYNLNKGISIKDMNYVYKEETNEFRHDDYNLIMTKIENKEEGVYYFGFDKCPWCKELLPMLEESLIFNNKYAYVIDTKSEYYSNEIKERAITFYKQNKYEKESDTMYVPYLVIIDNNGQVKTHIDTVENHDAKTRKMTKKERNELLQILNSLLS